VTPDETFYRGILRQAVRLLGIERVRALLAEIEGERR